MKTIIWDFNGTILDDVDVAVKIVNSILKELNYKHTLTKEEYKDIFKFPVIEYYELAGVNFDIHPFEYVSELYIKYLNIYVNESSIYKDFYNLINLSKSKGYNNVILSATRNDMLLNMIKDYKLEEYFDEIYGISDIYAHSKLDIAKTWNSTSKYAKNEKIYIGDTCHDWDVALSIDATPYIICSGHQSRKRLEENDIKVYNNLSEVMLCLE